MFFQTNLPLWERALRVLAGVLCAYFAYLNPGWIRYALLVASATSFLTAFLGFCPACAMLGRRLPESKNE
jgi:hypothetical protein